MKTLSAMIVALAGMMVFGAGAATVKITSLGSHDGELCPQDRALIFEDPNGTRLLYDVGRTVTGPEDPRLGKIDVVLVSHMHGDHAGDQHMASTNAGTCGKPEITVKAVPDTSSARIAVAKKAKIVTGSEMPAFFAGKMKALGGNPADSLLVRFGASRKIGGVAIASVPAVHSNGLDHSFLDAEHAKALEGTGLTAYVGPPGGYVLTFTNGLVVYLSGDTGITAEQELVVRRHYNATLAVMNIGDVFTTGPTEAAYVINDLVKPNAVIASHANEGATQGGKVLPNTRTAAFMKAVKVPVHVPLSGKTMEFGRDGKCTAGC